MTATIISWTDETWNPTTGCSKVSEGCRFCYAERLSLKFGWSKKPWTKRNAKANVVLHPERLRKPYSYKKPSRVFVNSMSDLFHELIPDDYVAQVFAVMNDLPQHVFQVLTKRSARAETWPGPWPVNVWMGTSIEDMRVIGRMEQIRRCGAQVKFLSLEPLLGRIKDLDLTGFQWVIVGGESGQTFRPMKMEWVREIRDACVKQGVAFFMKQDAGYRTELRPWVVEEDGSRSEFHQYPGQLSAPVPVSGSRPKGPTSRGVDLEQARLF